MSHVAVKISRVFNDARSAKYFGRTVSPLLPGYNPSVP